MSRSRARFNTHPRHCAMWLGLLALLVPMFAAAPASSAPQATPVSATRDGESSGVLTIAEYQCPAGTEPADLSACTPALQPWDVTVQQAQTGAKFSTFSNAVAGSQGNFKFEAIPAGVYTIIGGDPDGPGKIEVLYAGATWPDGDLMAVAVKPGSDTAFSIYSIPPVVAGELPSSPSLGSIMVRLFDCPAGTDIPIAFGTCRPEATFDVLVTHLATGREWSMLTEGLMYSSYRFAVEFIPGGDYRLTPVSDSDSIFMYEVIAGRVAIGTDHLAYVTLADEGWPVPGGSADIVIFRIPLSS